MIVAPPGLPAERVCAVVREEWDVEVATAEHLEVGAGAWHWRIGGGDGPAWFATVESVRTSDERRRLLAAYEATAELASRLPFVVPPVRTRDARLAVDVAPGLLLTLAPFLEGPSGSGPLADDAERGRVAGLLGDLHRPAPAAAPAGLAASDRLAPARRARGARALPVRRGWTGGPGPGRPSGCSPMPARR